MTIRSAFSTSSSALPGWNPLTLAMLSGVWIAALPNWPLWRALAALPEMNSARGWFFMTGFSLMIAALATALLALAAWRFTIKPAITVLLLMAATGAHFMGSYGVVIDPTMMTSVVQTDAREVSNLLSWRLFGSVLVLAGFPAVVIWRVRLRPVGVWAQAARNAAGLTAALLLMAAVVMGLFGDLSATMRNHKSLRYLINPANSVYGLIAVGVRSKVGSQSPLVPIGVDATVTPRAADARPPLLLLVVGETARADHFALNGYARPTSSELAALGVTSYRNVTSCATHTAASLPCMFSHLGKARFEARAADHENLLDLVQRAGMAVLWLDNQAGCKGLCDRVPNAFARNAPVGGPPLPAALCNAGECLDAALLVGLDARVAALPAQARERGVLIVSHQMGSHGPDYYKRSPANRKPFQPECTSSLLQQCEPKTLINSYDNSIAYTSHVLAQAVQWLKRQSPHYDATMLYLSDHGESLGENNLYLHGLPGSVAPREQTHVPLMVWLSAQSQAQSNIGVTTECLRAQRDTALSHDNLFHSVLGLLGIQASEYRPALDAFAACRKPPSPVAALN